jgi:hypothetical protein
MGLNYGPSVVKSGLVLALDAADINSYPGTGTTWYDLSGNKNHVTLLNSPSYISSKFGGYFANDSDSYFSGVGTSTIPTGNSPYTMLVWARQNSTYGWGPNNGFISIGGFGTYYQSNSLRTVDNTVGHFWHYWWGYDIGLQNNNAGLALDKWFMVAATYNGTNRTIWVNGILRSTDIPSQTHNVTSTDILISRTYTTEYQQGDIAIARIYNRALTSDEMLQTYNIDRTRFNLN